MYENQKSVIKRVLTESRKRMVLCQNCKKLKVESDLRWCRLRFLEAATQALNRIKVTKLQTEIPIHELPIVRRYRVQEQALKLAQIRNSA